MFPAPPPPPAPVTATGPSRSGTVADADRSLAAGDFDSARAIYRYVANNPSSTHAELLRAGEGLYRTQDFRTAVRAFDRAGATAKGEEQYRYYYAVALYETGKYAAAKRELAAAVPFIRQTPDVARYRAKIEGAID